MEHTLAVASAVLGRALADPVELGAGLRARVLRCRDSAGGSVVVKSYHDTVDGRGAFVAEAAGLAFAAAGPELLAVDTAEHLIVMADLGDAPSLADVLLGDDPAAATEALLAWARAYGRLAAATVGRQGELAELRARYGRDVPDGEGVSWVRSGLARTPSLLDSLGIPRSARLTEDLATIGSIVDVFPVFSPGDICPDNNLLTPQGLRVLDFEGAGYHGAFLDAAYTRMPFATCWCVWQMPPDVAARVEAAYREEVVAVHPRLADDEVWNSGVCLANAAWTLDMTGHLYRTGADREDRPTHSSRRPVPTIRQLIRYRWQRLLDDLEPAGALPALASVLRDLLARTHGWPVPPLAPYPAFRDS